MNSDDDNKKFKFEEGYLNSEELQALDDEYLKSLGELQSPFSSELDALLAEQKKQDDEYLKSLGELQSPFSSELDALLAEQKLEIPSWTDLPDFSWTDLPDLDLAEQKFELPGWVLDDDVSNTEAELLPPPDPNIKAKDVADWMLTQVNLKESLCQKDAAFYIYRCFGERFIYRNPNHNFAIAKDVLAEFLRISLKTVVWNKRGFYWRLRQASDPNGRAVDN
jgi:hypothetical protein